ncbi:hypothetical protein [Lactiplantibacillus mudanjiangensis]|uniref:HTH merR-type domain-containing protein n=1 Tax=Lactiplantibacillus mudanjiangensis TaxID=1296538 RepID=A0A660DWQ2_9LACO|nr:hypothetical protein [Lactiplantibacillus mudanjiangensis]VDG24954.1 hypothetical protein MUDAN_IGPPGNFN_02948 [Lactiplantibacillus mudanjiangensis]VDG28162.1 hypothetical protein MUDAN_MDHGFNIF_02886 [Lactiplantibacillus mudanjiangensis]VDG31120.1 hypothetical protein MUDAN_DOGOELCO_00621 [Lactiplantibacillus mudanjiangensis]
MLTVQALSDTGMSLAVVKKLMASSKPQQQIQLNDYRKHLLSTIHQSQQQLYCVDFLIRQLQERNDD